MTKTVAGAAMLLNAMASDGYRVDYVGALDKEALGGVRVGVLRNAQGSNRDIIERFDAAIARMADAGAHIVEIVDFDTGHEDYGRAASDVLHFEFKATINEYLANAAPEVEVRSLDRLIAFNREHGARELALFDQDIFENAAARGGLDDPQYTKSLALVQSVAGERGIDAMLSQFEVDVLVAPSGPLASRVDPINGDVWPDWVGAGWMAAAAGYPHLTVPMGSVHGIPIGVSFIGGRGTDAKMLAYGFAYEQASRLRVEPAYLENARQRNEISAAMQRPARNASR
jgi:amidase